MTLVVGSNLDFNNQTTGINVITPVASGDIVPLGFLNTVVDGLLKNPTGLDASTSPAYPAAQAGDTFNITVAGDVGGDPVQVGDLVIAINDTVGGIASDYIIISGKALATETLAGQIEIATQVEVDAGTDDARAVTPLKLETRIDNRLTPTGIDASTNPNYPAAEPGQVFHFTAAGLIGGGAGQTVEVGDVAIALVDTAGGNEATAGADFIILQMNLTQATQTNEGFVRFATQPETDLGAGGSDQLAISPVTLAGYISSLGTSKTEFFTIGDGILTTIPITHTMSNQYVHVEVYEISSGDKWMVCTDITGATTFNLDFAVAPTTNQFEVVVTGLA